MEMGALDVSISPQSCESCVTAPPGWAAPLWGQHLWRSWNSRARGEGAFIQPTNSLKNQAALEAALSQQFLPSAATRTPSLAQQVGFSSDGTPASS